MPPHVTHTPALRRKRRLLSGFRLRAKFRCLDVRAARPAAANP